MQFPVASSQLPAGYRLLGTGNSRYYVAEFGFGEHRRCQAGAPSPAWCPRPRRPRRNWSSCSPSPPPCRPSSSMALVASSRVIVGSVPVRTNVLPASGPGAPAAGRGLLARHVHAGRRRASRPAPGCAARRRRSGPRPPRPGRPPESSAALPPARRAARPSSACAAPASPRPSRRRAGCRARRSGATGRSASMRSICSITLRPTLPSRRGTARSDRGSFGVTTRLLELIDRRGGRGRAKSRTRPCSIS